MSDLEEEAVVFMKEKIEHRKRHWQNFYDKYANSGEENDEDDDNSSMSVEDIVNVYGNCRRNNEASGKRKRQKRKNFGVRSKRKSIGSKLQSIADTETEASDVQKINNESVNCKRRRLTASNDWKIKAEVIIILENHNTTTHSPVKDFCEEPNKNTKKINVVFKTRTGRINEIKSVHIRSRTSSLEYDECVVDTFLKKPLKQKYPDLIEIKETDSDNSDANRNSRSKSGVVYSERSSQLVYPFSDTKMKSPRRKKSSTTGRLSSEDHNTTSLSPVKDFCEEPNKNTKEINVASFKTRRRTERLNEIKSVHIKSRTSSLEYDECVVDTFLKKQLKQKYPDLIEIEEKDSGNSDTNRNSRSKSGVDYSERSSQLVYPFSDTKMKSPKRKKSSTTGRLSSEDHNTTSLSPVKDFCEEPNKNTKEINVASFKPRRRTERLNEIKSVHIRSNTSSLEYEECVVDTFLKKPLKQKYPDLIEIEETDSDNSDANRNSRSKSGVDYSERSSQLVHPFADTKMKSPKRKKSLTAGRLSSEDHNTTSLSPVKDFCEESNKNTKEINVASFKTRRRTERLNEIKSVHIKSNTSSLEYEECVVDTFLKKQLKQKYPDLIEIEAKDSGNSDTNRNSRSKSGIDYSERSSQLVYPFSDTKMKSPRRKKSSTTGRLSSEDHNTASLSPVKDFCEEPNKNTKEINVASFKTRRRTERINQIKSVHIRSNTSSLEYEECVVDTFLKKQLKQKYPDLIEIEEKDSGNSKTNRNSRSKSGVDYSERSSQLVYPFSDTKMKSPKRKKSSTTGRLSSENHNTTGLSPVEDFCEEPNKNYKDINGTSPEPRSERIKETKPVHTGNKSSSLTYEEHNIVRTFLRKKLKEIYPDLFEKEEKHSGNSDTNRNSRRKSDVDYSEKSLQPLYPFCEKIKSPHKSSTTHPHSPPGRTCYRNENSGKALTVKPPLQKSDEKKNDEEPAKETSVNLDSKMLCTKYIIEENLKSNLGLLMVKRYYSLRSGCDRENDFSFWNNAVKSEMRKLTKILPMEDLEQYIKSHMNVWLSQKSNM